MTELIKALQTHWKNIIYQPPDYAGDLKLFDEQEIEEEISHHKEEILKKEKLLIDISKSKSILWLKGNELSDNLISSLEKLGIMCKKDDIGEDF